MHGEGRFLRGCEAGRTLFGRGSGDGEADIAEGLCLVWWGRVSEDDDVCAECYHSTRATRATIAT